MKVIVSGAIANKYRNGGEAWVRLSWIQALQTLDHEVLFLEQIDRKTCMDLHGEETEFRNSAPLTYFRRVMDAFGLAGSSALIYENGEEIHGLSKQGLLDSASEADLLVNISGHLSCPPVMERVRHKAYIDIDPGFTQFWHADGAMGSHIEAHDAFYTIGENIGAEDCPIPTCGLNWRPIRQPVCLEQWPVVQEGDPRCFTTIASWRGPFGSVHYGGRTYGLKLHEFRKFMELPTLSSATFELALDIHPAEVNDLELLHRNKWQLVNPKEMTVEPESFRRYIQTSGAEFSAAQGIYVDTNSGWFSDRTTRYLSSGKPALVQETGFSRNLPVGEGLLSFRTLEDAVAGADEILSDYERHSRAAREIAEELFAPEKALRPLLEDAGALP